MLKNNILIFFVMVMLFSTNLCAQTFSLEDRGTFDRGLSQSTFVPKGQLFFGGNFSYFNADTDDYRFLVLKDLKAGGYTFSLSPFIGYFFADNMAAGARFKYVRTEVRLDNLDIKLMEDMSFSFKDSYYINHTYYGSVFLRNYLSFGENRIFAMFNEVRLTLGGGQGKITDGKGEVQTGTYENVFKAELGVAPGIIAFLSNNVAAEVSVGVLGINYLRTEQVTNQVEKGTLSTSSGSFKINLLSINIGVAFYIPV